MLVAHSADLKKGIPAQSYAAHVCGVVSHAIKAAEIASKYCSGNGKLLNEIVRRAAEYHDLGKLGKENQDVLSGLKKARHLPVQHTDAGTAFLLNGGGLLCDAILVRSHHIGLPDFIDETNRPVESLFRDDNVRNVTAETLPQLLEYHKNAIEEILPAHCNTAAGLTGNSSIFFRIALSCLVDGDHTDTAINYKEYPEIEHHVDLKPAERLAALDKYVAGLCNSNDERSNLRTKMYQQCRDSNVTAGIVSCDSPVGSGKTTAVMAHLLSQAAKRGLRRIIVVLPFTNIITQSVEVYRKALVLPNEKPEDVVAELHHRADFQDVHSRHLTMLWNAPIIVTTAVTFFETLASNTPSTLRRLHKMPGSAIFVDESHAALPAKLLPIAWDWIKAYKEEWCCYWVLASGSLNRFWQIPEFDKNPPEVPEIVDDELRNTLMGYEKHRIAYDNFKKPQTAEELVVWIASLPGPRIVILNTVQSAAAVATLYAKNYGRGQVEHLSTSLTPNDRAATLTRIKSRLKNPHYEKNGDWTLIATSCVEAGVDFSFRTGIRELGSLVSLLQTAGRVNRHGEYDNATVWTVRLEAVVPLKAHPGLKDAAQVLQYFYDKNIKISPDLCTEALKREVRLAGTELENLLKAETEMRFPIVEKEFRVITGDTRTVIVGDKIVKRLEAFEPVDWKDIQNNSVNIWGYRLNALNIPEIKNREGMYQWTLDYDSFVGYMAGVLKIEAFTNFIGDACII